MMAGTATGTVQPAPPLTAVIATSFVCDRRNPFRGQEGLSRRSSPSSRPAADPPPAILVRAGWRPHVTFC